MAAPTLAGRPQQARASAPANAQPKSVPAIPFTRASRRKSALAFDTGNVQLGASTSQVAPIELPPAGFLKWVELDVAITSAGNSATVAFQPDAPFSVITFINLTNSAGDTIIVPISGYQLFLLNKYGVFAEDAPFCDPKRDPNYATTTGSGATGGTARFLLRIPIEIDPRDALCALPNLAANKSYQVQLMFAPLTQIYSTSPTVAPTVRVTGYMHFWSQPNSANALGTPQQTAPDGNGSVNMIRVQTIPVTQGDKLFNLSNVGNVIRFAIFVLRTAAGVRSAADLPATNQVILNNDTMFYLPLAEWQSDIATSYGYNVGAIDAAGGLDSGVLTLHQFMEQRGRVLCDGPRDQYLPTLDATLLQVRGTSFGATAATLEVITNEIKPISAAALYSPNVV